MGNDNEVNEAGIAENVITMTQDELDEIRCEAIHEGGNAILEGMAITAGGLVLIGLIVWGVKKLIGVFKRKKTDTENKPDSEKK